MKKVVKIIVLVVIVLLVLLLINAIRNYTIYQKIENAETEIFSSSNYHVSLTSEMLRSGTKFHNDIYYKDEICLINTYTNGELTAVYWKDYSTGEDLSYHLNDVGEKYTYTFNEDLITSIKFGLHIRKNYFSIISVKDNCYAIKYDVITSYYNKNTGILEKFIYENSEDDVLNTNQEYTYEVNTVTDADIEKPAI